MLARMHLAATAALVSPWEELQLHVGHEKQRNIVSVNSELKDVHFNPLIPELSSMQHFKGWVRLKLIQGKRHKF